MTLLLFLLVLGLILLGLWVAKWLLALALIVGIVLVVRVILDAASHAP